MIDKETILRLARENGAVFDVLAMGRHDGVLFTETELERFTVALLSHRAESGVEVPFATAFADPLDLVNDANRDIFSVKHASEWHEGLRFNAALFTHDQLLAYGNARAAEALERAAKVAHDTCHHETTEFANGFNQAALNIEALIRSLTP